MSGFINPTVTLASGHTMPMVALGTWKAPPGVTGAAVEAAIKAGYRNIDAANDYNKGERRVRGHRQVGEAPRRRPGRVAGEPHDRRVRAADRPGDGRAEGHRLAAGQVEEVGRDDGLQEEQHAAAHHVGRDDGLQEEQHAAAHHAAFLTRPRRTRPSRMAKVVTQTATMITNS